MKNKFFLGTLVFILLWTSFPVYGIADEYDDKIAESEKEISELQRQTAEARKAIENLQGEKEKTKSNVENLKNQKEGFQNQINDYSNKLNVISKEISANEAEMDTVSANIVRLSNELSDAKAQEEERYKNLKLRIKATYEKGGDRGVLQTLLGSGSFRDFLTKFEYLNAVVSYDNKKISEYKALQREIESKTDEVKHEEERLQSIQDELDNKQDTLESLTATVNGQLSTTNKTLNAENGKLADYDKELARLDQLQKELAAKVASAQAEYAKRLADRPKENTGGAYAASDSELLWLAATIQAEADGESYQGKLGVGSVIMNRVKSSAFPNDVVGVITQNMQFASYRSGKVELIMGRGPNAICIKAAQEVLNGARIGDYLFFMTRYWADHYGIAEYTMLGNHAFFYKWVVKEKAPEEPQPEQQQEQQPEQNQEAPAEEQHEEENHEEEHHDDDSDDDDDDSDDDE
ncbi:cell wall hydrolase [Butyrivibrio sp. M55]|uniref:cell wall hydrolase n=1 Tax=Butyrivibrio sp. M55 TaxID=1855323 RepID=UPI0008DF0B92|nr:cell wall hydrolase [Butyrivibrio sp. M55]SFU44940.1 N-terminal domain of peptidoglycan hydrolase CwlO-containing protein [Butyrivibrio sp. M55]